MKFERLTQPATERDAISLAELVGAFSYALDLTEGQPEGHCIRACWIGMHVGKHIGLAPAELDELYFAILLKDLGCSSNAARVCELYQADDRAFKQGYKTVGTSLAATIHFIASKTARNSPWRERAGAVGNILRNGESIAQELIVSRCTRGADIARRLRFSEGVAEAIYRLDEHWDGSGRPGKLAGNAIPAAAQIALLGQVADVFLQHAGRQAAIDEIARRSGKWFDPALAQAFESVARDARLWEALDSPFLEARLAALAPANHVRLVDEDYLDDIAAAFGEVVDAKSPFTAGHSTRVADIASSLAEALGVPAVRRRWLHRGALLHDIGKLGVSNAILDKPGSLGEEEWREMRDHAVHTQAILGRIGVLRDLAPIAAAHHERLDGTGYPLGLSDLQIRRETRIITICDFFDALTADRPYRAAMPVEQALGIIGSEVGQAIDADCFEALKTLIN